jgi:hypothetical protein
MMVVVSDRGAVGGDKSDALPPLAEEDHICQCCRLSYQDISIESAIEIIHSIPTEVRDAVLGTPKKV